MLVVTDTKIQVTGRGRWCRACLRMPRHSKPRVGARVDDPRDGRWAARVIPELVSQAGLASVGVAIVVSVRKVVLVWIGTRASVAKLERLDRILGDADKSLHLAQQSPATIAALVGHELGPDTRATPDE